MKVDYLGTEYSQLHREYLNHINNKLNEVHETQIDKFYNELKDKEIKESKVNPSDNEKYSQLMIQNIMAQPMSQLSTDELLSIIKLNKNT